jgi:hypothetical protein
MTQKDIIQKTESIDYILANWNTMSNKQMADHLGVCVQYVRNVCYKHGLYRMRLEYWTSEQIEFLSQQYRLCGDKELAEMFQQKWPKKKSWTLKHIEKKRKYLGLKRTPGELYEIKQKAKAKGVYVLGLQKTWMKRGAAPEGSVVEWATDSQWPSKWIKINGKFISYYRYLWQQAGNTIPENFNVVPKMGVTEVASVNDLECISRKEHQKRCSQKAIKDLSDNYVAATLSIKNKELREQIKQNPQIIKLKRNQILLQRSISKTLNTLQNAK